MGRFFRFNIHAAFAAASLAVPVISCPAVFAQGGAIVLPPSPDAVTVPPPDVEPPVRRQPRSRRQRSRPAGPAGAVVVLPEPVGGREQRPSTAQKVTPIEPLAGVSHAALFNLSLHYPLVRTRGSERRDYHAETSSLLEILFRAGSPAPGEMEFWYGIAAYGLQGTGIQDGLPGRFAYVFAGPRAGFCQFLGGHAQVRGEPARDRAAGSQEAAEDDPLTWSRFHFLSMGINARITASDRDPSIRDQERSDFTQGAGWDGPGISARYGHHWFLQDGFAVGPGAGVVLASGKTFAWLEIGVSLFL